MKTTATLLGVQVVQTILVVARTIATDGHDHTLTDTTKPDDDVDGAQTRYKVRTVVGHYTFVIMNRLHRNICKRDRICN